MLAGSLLWRIRLEIGDLPNTFASDQPTDGISVRYEIPYHPLDAATVTVLIDNEEVADGFVVDARNGAVTFEEAPAEGNLGVRGTFWRYFTDEDLQVYADSAVAQHVYHRQDAFGRQVTLENLAAVEEYPLVLLGSIQALWALATDASFDIDIYAPDGVNIPRSQRYRQLMEMIEAKERQYKDLSAALNIGLNRIEVFTLRRTSQRTGRLVPVYIPQEVDDRSVPQRAWLPIDTQGAAPIPTSVGTYDLDMYQGDPFSRLLDFSISLTGHVVKAQVRTYPESPVVAAEFTVDAVDLSLGKVRISLTGEQTRKLPVRAYWDVEAYPEGDYDSRRTYIAGAVFTKRQVTRQPVPGTSDYPEPPWLHGTAQEGYEEESGP